MDRNNRPVGRQKRIGSGTGSVYRRGNGLGGRTGGPVGGGYSGRPRGSSSGYSGFSGGFGGFGGPGPTRRNNRNYSRAGGVFYLFGKLSRLKSTLSVFVFIIIAIIALLSSNTGDGNLFGNLLGNNQNLYTNPASTANHGSSHINTITYNDNGPYDVNRTVSEKAREKYTLLRGNGDDVATIMIYLCGTDLESKSGMATSDLKEIINAQVSEKVNIIVETGGTMKWRNSAISSNTNQRFKVTQDGLQVLEKDLGKRSMVDPNTLADFIRYCKNSFPADRYILIMWTMAEDPSMVSDMTRIFREIQ